MKFTKRLLTIALSMSMVMPLCATAYAAKTVTISGATIKANADPDLYDVTVTFTVEESSKQVTLLLTGPNADDKLDDNDIVHINQFGKNNPDEAVIVSGSGTCTFSVSKARIAAAGATVNESAGTTTLSVSMGADDATEAASADVTYEASEPAEVNVTGVDLVTAINLTVGNKQTLVAVVKPADATNKNVTWESSNTDVATVDAAGEVTAVAEGTATITVTTVDGRYTAECTVTVSAAPIPATDIELKTATELAVGRAETLTATLTPSNATSTVTWVSSDTEVATVDTNGKVTAVAVGSATITAFVDADENGVLDDGEVSATCAVTVVEAPAFVKGDATGDDTVNILDCNAIFEHIMGRTLITDATRASAADVTGDSAINILDFNKVFEYVMGRGNLD